MHVIAISQADKDTGLCWTAISLNGRYLGGTFQNDDAINDIINNKDEDLRIEDYR